MSLGPEMTTTNIKNKGLDTRKPAKCHVRNAETLFLPMDRICSILSGAGKFCLAHGPGQLTGDVKSYVRTLTFKIDVTFCTTTKKHQMAFGKGRYAT